MADDNPDAQATAAAAAAEAQASAGDNGAAELARLQAQVEAATGSVQRAFEVTQTALRAANPNLPEIVFEATGLDMLIANVEAHRATAAHIQEQITANPPPPDNPSTPAGAGTTRQVTVPANTRGVARIAFALDHPGPGMTE